MKYCTGRHQFTCGVDLHARTMFLCVLDERGYPLLEKNIKTDPQLFLKAIAPCREDVVVAVECIFSWYWLADLCSRENIAFVLGHALSMKATHGGKANTIASTPTSSPPCCGACLLVASLRPTHPEPLAALLKHRKSEARLSIYCDDRSWQPLP